VSAKRGFTIAETMVVAVILGMMLTAIVGAIAPLFSAPSRAQAKIDSVEPAATSMYVMERDLRESDENGVFACTGQPVACGDGALTVGDIAIALPTALANGSPGAQFLTNNGVPDWQGFVVYWQPAPGGEVDRAFEQEYGLNPLINTASPNRVQLQTLAAAAVASALNDPNRSIAMREVATFATAIDVNSSITSLHIVSSGSAGGKTNTTTFDDDIFARN
jgi:prepilin-type N-terminal cleavage/methylation domain-containing protein